MKTSKANFQYTIMYCSGGIGFEVACGGTGELVWSEYWPPNRQNQLESIYCYYRKIVGPRSWELVGWIKAG